MNKKIISDLQKMIDVNTPIIYIKPVGGINLS